MRVFLSLISIVVAVTFSAGQKTQPSNGESVDLTGVWNLNPTKSDLRRLAKYTAETVVIRQTPKTIEMEQILGDKRKDVVYSTDGSSQLVSTFDHHERFARAYWKKGTLIVEENVVGHFAGVPDFEDIEPTKTYWRRSEDGKALTVKNGEKAVTAIYELQE